jgi:hypothetical protein
LLRGTELINKLHGLDAHGGDSLDQIHDIGGVVVFIAPVVGIVDYAGCLVGLGW